MHRIALKIAQSFLLKQARDYSCLTCPFPWDVALEIRQWAKNNIPSQALTGDGFEPDVHVTLKYGLHGHDPIAVRQLIGSYEPFDITLGKMSVFENKDQDVVKIDVESPRLHELNKIVSDNFEHTNTFPDYVPHVTLAYVKPGVGAKYVGNETFAGRKVLLTGVLFSGNDYRETLLPLLPKSNCL